MAAASPVSIPISRWRTVIGYAVLATAWILTTDLLLDRYVPAASFLRFEMIKGWLFVVTTAVFLKLLIERHFRKMRRADWRLHSIIDCMADGVLLVDRHLTTCRVNPAAVRLFGMKDEASLLGSFVEIARTVDARHPDGRPIQPDGHVIWRALRGETIHLSEIVIRRHDGVTVSVAMSAAPVYESAHGDIPFAVAVLRDVTEVKQLERLRDEFLSIAAHELKTPLTTLKGYVQLLRRQSDTELVRSRSLLDIVNRQCDRLARLIQELLEVARLRLGTLRLHRTTFDLREVAAEAIELLRGSGTALSLRLEAEPGALVSADRERIHQVLLNLLDNAIKFSNGGSEIAVRLTRGGDEVVASVTDRGVGIPGEKQAQLFERFFQAHAGTEHDRGGMGVGLFICREIVARHGGRIWVDSAVGRGSTFHFSLPCVGTDARVDAP